MDKLTNQEFSEMLQLLKRYAESEMDQWEMWKIQAKGSEIYINMSWGGSADGCEESYADLTHMLPKEKAES